MVMVVIMYTALTLIIYVLYNIYIHSPNLGHYNSTGVRGESSIVIKGSVSSSFGYILLDSVVAQHDKIEVSRKLFKTMGFSFRNVHGNVIDSHGALFPSFS